MQRKGLVIVLDGCGDRPQPALGGATPLEAAATPVLDRLVSEGQCGSVDPILPGVPVGTQTGSGAIMGLAPDILHELSRGPVEAAGVGVELAPGDVALRANFATVRRDGERLLLVDRWAGRIREGTAELAAALEGIDVGEGVTATLHPATQHRAVVRLSGPALSERVTDTDPGDSAPDQHVRPCLPRSEDDPAAVHTARAIDRLVAGAHERFADHPVNRDRAARGLPAANGLITRSAGQVRELRSIVNRLGIATAVVAAERTLLGLGRLLGYDVHTEPGFTSLSDTDLDGKVAAARRLFGDHQLVFLHVKAPDICSHDRDPERKRDVLERIDAALAPLLEEDELVIGVTADHSTDSATGSHCGEPVPSLLRRPGGRRDRVRTFGETECMAGGLGRIPSLAFLMSVLDAMGVVPTYRVSDRGLLGLS